PARRGERNRGRDGTRTIRTARERGMSVDRDDRLRALELVLGRLPAGEEQEVRALMTSDAELAEECRRDAELLRDLRTLTTVPSGRVPLALAYATRRREDLRQPPVTGLARVVWFGTRVVAVAAAVLLMLMAGARLMYEPVTGTGSARSLASATTRG